MDKEVFYELAILTETKDQAIMLSNCYYNKKIFRCSYDKKIEKKIIVIKNQSNEFITTDFYDLSI